MTEPASTDPSTQPGDEPSTTDADEQKYLAAHDALGARLVQSNASASDVKTAATDYRDAADVYVGELAGERDALAAELERRDTAAPAEPAPASSQAERDTENADPVQRDSDGVAFAL